MLQTPQSVLDYSPKLYPVPMSPSYALLAKVWLWPSDDDDDDDYAMTLMDTRCDQDVM